MFYDTLRLMNAKVSQEMKVQNILIDKMIIFFNADIITLYIKELRLLGKIHAHARHFLSF
jgi:hypothetical protein